MPNHVTNKVLVTGSRERLDAFIEYVKEDDAPFSLNKIVPMPQILRETESGSRQHEGERVLQILEGTFTDASFLALDKQGHWEKCGVNDLASYAEYMQRENPKSIELAKLSRLAVEQTGCKTWYEWALQNWGTKWDAYSQSFEDNGDGLVYQFDTAWYIPAPVYDIIIEEFNDLDFTMKYFDEGHGFWGEIFVKNGEISEERDSIEADRKELCIELKGYDPTEDEEEE